MPAKWVHPALDAPASSRSFPWGGESSSPRCAFPRVFDVPEQFSIDVLRETKTFTIKVKDQEFEVDSKNTIIIPDVNPRSRRFKMITLIDSKKVELAPGMSATAAIPSKEKRDYMFVPANAVLRDSGGEFVYKIVSGQDGKQSAMA